jgi:APA family basic amino acid/polyamine antiporter
MSTVGAFAYNMLSVFILAPFAFLTAVFAFPDGDLLTASLIALVFSLFSTSTYAMLATSFPRSGGDYVFQSRILRSGAIGFPMVFNAWVVWQAVVVAVLWIGSTAIATGIVPYFVVMGYLTSNQAITNFGYWLFSPLGGTIVGAVILTFVYAVMIAGFKWFVRLNWVIWAGYLLGAIVIAGVFLVTPNSAFVSGFNTLMNGIGVHIPSSFNGNAYKYVIDTASQSINVNPATTLTGTFGSSMVIAINCQIWAILTIGILGEIKGAGSVRRNMISMPLAGVAASLLMSVIILGYVSSVGREFITAAAWGFYNYAIDLTIPPYFGFLAMALTTNYLLIFLMMIGIFFGAVFIVFQIVQYATRAMFAMSLDRVLPSFLCDVDRRTRTPVKAHLALLIPGLIYTPIYYFLPSLYAFTLGTLVTGVACQFVTLVCAGIFPYTAKDIYKASPISKYKLGSIPLITLTAIVGLFFIGSIIAVMVTNPLLGVIAPYPVEALGSIIGTFILFLAVYYIVKWYRAKQGVDLTLTYREIPPE